MIQNFAHRVTSSFLMKTTTTTIINKQINTFKILVSFSARTTYDSELWAQSNVIPYENNNNNNNKQTHSRSWFLFLQGLHNDSELWAQSNVVISYTSIKGHFFTIFTKTTNKQQQCYHIPSWTISIISSGWNDNSSTSVASYGYNVLHFGRLGDGFGARRGFPGAGGRLDWAFLFEVTLWIL